MKGFFGFGIERTGKSNAGLNPGRLQNADKRFWSRNNQAADAIAEKTRDLLDRFDGERVGPRLLIRD